MKKVADTKVIMVYEVCPECENGSMEYVSGSPVLTTYPGQYLHRCKACGYETYYTGHIYPEQKIIPVEDWREPIVGELND